ncbi:uncharacterized protein F5147DRAFT_657537 [Suillus discolor]|uniref:Uncharacterized protein n=1 Tax=Suillus discolor TaxID=1912936 RepID=A0A9P7EX02_9AGAM|nr:uncharacterized protein F5147DRAFT_657537 [Suillus discolor]KAG2092923.1 hypothetical protein F5147DRAFT_657537 [Suillus discolor]
MHWAFAHGIRGVGNGVVELLNLGEFTCDLEYRFTLPLLSPSRAAALAWLGLTAQPELLQSPSPPKPGLSRGFQAEPGPHITTSNYSQEADLSLVPPWANGLAQTQPLQSTT